MKKNFYLMMLCMLSVCSCKDVQQAPQGTDYKTIRVKTTGQTIESDYASVLRGRQSVEIRPQVSGTITDIRINEGDKVRKGQTLFILDQLPYRAALNTAKAKVKSAASKLETARLTLESKTELRKENIISDFDLQTASNKMKEAEAALAQAEAEEMNAQTNLSYTEIKSPVNGVASMIPYRIGALVNSGIAKPLVTVSDDSEIYAYFSMPENQMMDMIQKYGSLEKAKADMPAARLKMSNGSYFPEKGKIDAISGTVDESTGVITLRAVFKNPGHLLRNGSTGSVTLPTVHDNSIVIPQSATYELQDRVLVWRVVDGKTKSTPITVYRHNDGRNYIVTSGLKEGDEIVAEGAGLLREGMPVNSKVNKK